MRVISVLLGLVSLVFLAATAGGVVYVLDSRLDERTLNTAVLLCAVTPLGAIIIAGVIGGLAWLDQRRWERRLEPPPLPPAPASDQAEALRIAREMVGLLATSARAQAVSAQAQRAQQSLLAPSDGAAQWEIPPEWRDLDA